MINWWLIAALVIVSLIIVKARHIKHKFFVVLFVLLILFFYLTLPRVIQGRDVNLQSFDGIVLTIRLYSAWLVHGFGNLKEITGNAVAMDWIGNQSSG